jgi:hypothetical protein
MLAKPEPTIQRLETSNFDLKTQDQVSRPNIPEKHKQYFIESSVYSTDLEKYNNTENNHYAIDIVLLLRCNSQIKQFMVDVNATKKSAMTTN